jgi:hypothetical protein
MRYCIREATYSDLDRVAALIVDNAGEWSGSAATSNGSKQRPHRMPFIP